MHNCWEIHAAGKSDPRREDLRVFPIRNEQFITEIDKYIIPQKYYHKQKTNDYTTFFHNN